MNAVRPAFVARLAGESVTLDGSNFAADTTVLIDGNAPESLTLQGSGRLLVELPLLTLGPHGLSVQDPFGQGPALPGALSVFDYEAGVALPSASGLLAANPWET